MLDTRQSPIYFFFAFGLHLACPWSKDFANGWCVMCCSFSFKITLSKLARGKTILTVGQLAMLIGHQLLWCSVPNEIFLRAFLFFSWIDAKSSFSKSLKGWHGYILIFKTITTFIVIVLFNDNKCGDYLDCPHFLLFYQKEKILT